MSAAASPAPASEGASIHPSRLRQVEADNSGFDGSYGGRGGFGGGRGFQRGRGAFGRGGMQRSFRPTGQNLAQPDTGMRSWGSTPVPDSSPATPTTNEGEDGAKKKKRKGDKGGTGSKANSSKLRTEEEPAGKKRKRDESAPPAPSDEAAAAAPSDRTLKRIRKRMGKIEKGESMSLTQWIDKVAQGKEKSVDRADVLAGLQVAFVDGKWQLSA